jgi:predicted Fe-Mo cluster-binding NifX family protein
VKIAAVTDDGETISQHFGRARYYKVYLIDDGTITGREMRDKAGHHTFGEHGHDHAHDHEHGHGQGRESGQGHGFGKGAAQRHGSMIAAIEDCDALLARGMGRGAYIALEEADITPIVTDIPAIEEAVQAYLDGEIIDHTERLH